MKRLLLLALFAAAPLAAQDYVGQVSDTSHPLSPPALSVVDYVTSQTQGTFLGAPCASNGAPTFRIFCDGDGVILGQGVTPGTQQTLSNNFNISGKGIAALFEVPSLGCFQGTALGKFCALATDGDFEISKATPDNTGRIDFGGNRTSSNAALDCTTAVCRFISGNGNGWPLSINQLRQSQVADTAATVALTATTASSLGNVMRRCDATSNTVAYTLPASTAIGTVFTIKKVDSSANTCTITRTPSDTIDGLTTVTLTNRGDWVTVADGTNSNLAWQILGGNQWGPGYAAGASDDKETCSTVQNSANGAQMMVCQMSELLTLSTSVAASDTTANMLCAGCIIDSVVTRVTSSTDGGKTFSVGDNVPTAARFTAAGSSGTAGSTTVGLDQWNPAGAAAANGPAQAAAAKVRITASATVASGIVRITVFYRKFIAPVS